MLDVFQFPNITGNTAEEKINQTIDYLIQFKEALEFAISNIGTDNLSQELLKKLNELGADVKKSNEDREDQLIQMSNNSITVYDVINSALFKSSLSSEVEKELDTVTFSVNFETGNLEYKSS